MYKSVWIVPVILFLMTFTVAYANPRNHGHYVVNRRHLTQGFSDAPFSDCGSPATKVEVVPCDDDICNLQTGSNATINISFTPKTDIAKLTAVVHGVVAGIPMPFYFPQIDACQNSNITCPLQSGSTYFYSVKLPVLKTYPKIKVTVKWELKDDGGKDVICVEIPARLR